MKQIERLQAKARQRFGFCGSVVIHFILFVVLAFSGVLAMQPPAAQEDTVVFFDAGGGGEGDEFTDEDETPPDQRQIPLNIS